MLPGHSLLLLGVSLGARLQVYWLPSDVHFPPTEGSNTGINQNTKWRRICIAAKWSVSPTAQAPHHAIILQGVVRATCQPD